MPDASFRTAARVRLGIPPNTLAVCRCTCGQALTANPFHALSCARLHGGVINQRHNWIVRTLATWCRRAGAEASVEPRNLSSRNEMRPDLLVIMGAQHFLIDVTVRNPAAPSHVRLGQTPGRVAAHAESDKRNQYREMAREQGAEFVQFALETFGTIGRAASEFVNKLADYATGSGSHWSRNEILFGTISSVQAALQRGNAYVMQRGFQQAAVSGGSRGQRLHVHANL